MAAINKKSVSDVKAHWKEINPPNGGNKTNDEAKKAKAEADKAAGLARKAEADAKKAGALREVPTRSDASFTTSYLNRRPMTGFQTGSKTKHLC